jgi:hypothetical protein
VCVCVCVCVLGWAHTSSTSSDILDLQSQICFPYEVSNYFFVGKKTLQKMYSEIGHL